MTWLMWALTSFNNVLNVLLVSNMVGTVSKSGGEIPRLESQIKDRILPTVPKKRKRTGKRLRVQRPLVERGISNIRKLGR
jgi:hypothetical protein